MADLPLYFLFYRYELISFYTSQARMEQYEEILKRLHLFEMVAGHLELSHLLNTDAFINALRRCICRSGKPRTFYSGNDYVMQV